MTNSLMETPGKRRLWRVGLLVVVVVLGLGGLATFEHRSLSESIASFGHLDWGWVATAVAAEAASMAAFARVQRKLLRAGGSDVHLRSVMAVTYAGNAISVSLPLAGSEVAAAFSFRQFRRHGIESAVVGWALALSGVISSFAFALVLAAGAVTSGSLTGALVGLAGAMLSLAPATLILLALRFQQVRRRLNRILAWLVEQSIRRFGKPGAEAGLVLEDFLERVASLRLPRLELIEVFLLALWNWVADCLCLAAAIRATGTSVPWEGLFLAYCLGMTAGSIGLTPGGLGVIEVALSAALVAVGMSSHRALAAVLVYRVISFWAVMMVGWVVMAVISRHRSPRPVSSVEPAD